MLLLLCLKLFFVRILDVSLGTIRTILTIKGKKFIASTIGFIEVAVWFAVVKEALNTDINSIWIVLSYAGGYATGTFVGAFISERFIKGSFGLQVITNNKGEVAEVLRQNGYAVSVIDIEGKDKENDKHMLFLEIDKKHFNHVKNLIKQIDPKAFIVVNETKFVQNGYFKQEK